MQVFSPENHRTFLGIRVSSKLLLVDELGEDRNHTIHGEAQKIQQPVEWNKIANVSKANINHHFFV